MTVSTPFLSKIRIFPVKSLAGVTVTIVSLLRSGSLENDRRYAIVNKMGNVINGKRSDAIYRLCTEFSTDLQTITVSDCARSKPAHFHIVEEQEALTDWLSDFFGESVSLMEDRAGGYPDDPIAHGPTLISLATLQTITKWFPELTLGEVRKRFRTNLEIDGVEPFWEDRLFGPASEPVLFRIGNVTLQGTNPCTRCVVPSRSAVGGERTGAFQKRFAELRRQHLPSWAEKSQFNHYYRLAVNTSLHQDNSAFVLQQGDLLTLVNR